jgi:hypothetical protein
MRACSSVGKSVCLIASQDVTLGGSADRQADSTTLVRVNQRHFFLPDFALFTGAAKSN